MRDAAERLERWAGGHRREFCLLLFVAGLALRTLAAALISRSTGLALSELALTFDGHVYLLIARSAPRLYDGIHLFFPAFRDSSYFTGWFPLYPVSIALAAPFFGWTSAALLVPRLAGAACAPLFFLLAARHGRRPALAAALFCVFPGTWLLTGSLAFVEPLYLLCVLGALLALSRERRAAAAWLCAGAALAQKTGVLLAPIALAAWGARPLKRVLPALGALAGLAALLAWHGLVFGDPMIGARVQFDIFGGSAFAFPFSSVTRGLLARTDVIGGSMLLRKLAVVLSLAFYGVALIWAFRERAKSDRLALAWRCVVFFFHIAIGFFLLGWLAYHAAPALFPVRLALREASP